MSAQIAKTILKHVAWFMFWICVVRGLILIAGWIMGSAEAVESPPPLCNHDAFHQELQAQREELQALKQEHADTRVLAAFGGAKMRGPKVLRVVSCDGSYIEGTFGEPAYRALRATGLCDPPSSLPGPETMTRR